jgi:hypothetical protein
MERIESSDRRQARAASATVPLTCGDARDPSASNGIQVTSNAFTVQFVALVGFVRHGLTRNS